VSVLPDTLGDYLRQKEEDDKRENYKLAEGQRMLQELNQNNTTYDLPSDISFAGDVGQALLPVEAYNQFTEGNYGDAALEFADYAKEMTGVAAGADLLGYGYNIPENELEDRNSIYASILAGNVGTAAMQALGVTPFGRITKAIDKARMANDVAVPTRKKDIAPKKARYLETAEDRNIPEFPTVGSALKKSGTYPSNTKGNYQDTYKAILSDNPNEIELPFDNKPLLSGMLKDITGSDLVNSIADRTGNRTVYQIGEDTLTYPINSRGGFTFLREDPDKAWAITGKSGSLTNDVLSRPDNDKILMPALMSASGGSNFNSAVIATAFDIVSSRGLMNRKNLAELNDTVRMKYKDSKRGSFVPFKLKDFKPENIQDTIRRVAVDGTADDKKAFAEALDSKKLKENDAFPDMGDIRSAHHNPDYDEIPSLALGLGAARLNKENLFNLNPTDPHTTYTADILGNPLMQQSEIFYPQQLIFPDFYNQVIRERGLSKYKDLGSKYKAVETGLTDAQGAVDSRGVAYDRSRAMQLVDDPLVENVARYEDEFAKFKNSDEIQELYATDREAYLNAMFDFYTGY
tara:strand:- start:405 stop:2129 length:1725 start_codon:yes stop_codon:yes gene_type:complete